MTEPSPVPVIVVGGGGHGRETVSLLRDAEVRAPGRWDLLGMVADEEPDTGLLELLDVPWLGPVEELRGTRAVVSVAVGEGLLRSHLHRRVLDLGCSPVTLIHPTAAIGLDVEIGRGCYIGALTVATTHVRLGEGVQVNVSCSLSHDVTIGDFATLSPGVRLAGGVIVEAGSTIYTAATVLPNVRVGRDAVVGAGAVVIKDVSDGETVVGVPARPLNKR